MASMDILRDAPIGQIIRFVTKNKVLQYPDEKADFVLPSQYSVEKQTWSQQSTPRNSTVVDAEKVKDVDLASRNALTMAATRPDEESSDSSVSPVRDISRITSRPDMTKVTTQADLEQAYEDAVRQETIKQQASRPIEPQKTADGRILVDWYTTDDMENPQNWPRSKKLISVFQLYFYTLAVYIGSAIFTPSIPYIMEQLHVSSDVASLGLSMYVLGYGVGPLLWSPLSEIPIIGRNPPYMITFAVFLILSIPTSLVNSFPALVVLRFLQGFFGSPALATGGASLGDMYNLFQLPYVLTGWAAFATAGPGLGPLVSGFSVPAENWHWSLYEIIWMAAPVFISMLFFLPETSAHNILLRRAARLRKLTGNANLVAQSEIDQANLDVKEIVVGNLWRPLQINILDPAVGFTSLYIGLIYGIFYSFFEAFPLVYGTGLPGSETEGYGMNAGEQGLIFLSVPVGVSIAIAVYVSYLYFVFNPSIRRNGLGAPEQRLVPGLFASLIAPAGLFIFAWTGFNSPKIHWIVPTIGIALNVVAVFILFQAIFIYIPLTYPRYAASLFAGNDFFRSSVAAGAIHFAHPLFKNLGIGRGVSLLGGLMFGGVIGIFFLYYRGAWLRSRSKFAAN